MKRLSISNLLLGHALLVVVLMLTPFAALTWVSNQGTNALKDNNTLYEGVLMQLDDIDVALKNARFHAYAGFMHDRALSVSKYHTHPYQLHVEAVESEFARAEKAWSQIFIHLETDSPYFDGIQDLKTQYDEYMRVGALPVLESMKSKVWRNIVANTTGAIPQYALFSESIEALQNKIAHDGHESYDRSQADINALTNTLLLSYALVIVSYIVFSIWLRGRIIKPLKSVLDVSKQIASGDLTSDSSRVMLGEDEFGLLLKQVDSMRLQLSTVIQQIVTEAEQVSKLSERLNVSQINIERSASSQEGTITSAASALEEMQVSIENISQNALGTSERAKNAEVAANLSSETIDHSEKNVHAVSYSLEKTSEKILLLSEKIQKVSAITDVIQDVAEKTNLLALNAAIEAARAGEQGRGFAVVADEVRNLAETTTKSVDEIETMISEIRDEVSLAVASVEETCMTAEKVVEATTQTKAAIGTINESTAIVQGLIADISRALTEQRVVSGELSSNVEAVAMHAKDNSQTVKDGVVVTNELADVSKKLTNSISGFKL